jgi:DNA-binding transcriptional LysR family regulator
MNLHHLAVFHAVAQAGSISRGADRLMISQPAVSKQMRELERRLHVKLLERHAKGVQMTAAGHLLADYASRIFVLAAEAEEALGDLPLLRRGSLSIGAGPTVGVYLLPRILVQFRHQFPGVRLHLETEGPDVLCQRLLDGMVDFGLTESVLDEPNLESKKIMTDVLVPIASPDNPLSKRRSVSAEEFCRQPFIAREIHTPDKSLVERSLAARGLAVQPFLTVGSTEAIKQAVSAGLGVAMVSRLAIVAEVAAGQLVEIPVKKIEIHYPIYHVRRRGRTDTSASMAFVSLLKTHPISGKASRTGF